MCVLPLTSEKFDCQPVLILGRHKDKQYAQVDEEYTAEMIEWLEKEVPLITTVCLRVIELAQMIWERQALEQLTEEVQEYKCLHEVNDILLRAIGKLARAHCALMINDLGNKKLGHCTAIWHSQKKQTEASAEFYKEFRLFATDSFSNTLWI